MARKTERKLKLRFEQVSPAEAGIRVADLRSAILDASSDVSAEIEKENKNSQDAGTTLVLALGAPAVVAIAKGIAAYLSRERGTLVVEENGRIVATGLSGADEVRIIEALSSR